MDRGEARDAGSTTEGAIPRRRRRHSRQLWPGGLHDDRAAVAAGLGLLRLLRGVRCSLGRSIDRRRHNAQQWASVLLERGSQSPKQAQPTEPRRQRRDAQLPRRSGSRQGGLQCLAWRLGRRRRLRRLRRRGFPLADRRPQRNAQRCMERGRHDVLRGVARLHHGGLGHGRRVLRGGGELAAVRRGPRQGGVVRDCSEHPGREGHAHREGGRSDFRRSVGARIPPAARSWLRGLAHEGRLPPWMLGRA
mmetsp:Transcript_101196/g.292634  ORF Transcript_101196/g.292634 Transcript_101196/m.292634 type:complete len:248 (-) Transcript_101196:260-1003(-)